MTPEIRKYKWSGVLRLRSESGD